MVENREASMWRKFEIPASEDVIREAAKMALPKVLESSGLSKTGLSRELYDCPSALGRFLSGQTAFSLKRIRILVDRFDEYLGIESQPIRGSDANSKEAAE